ncbi:hypothetical protein ABIE12_003064 [Serratia sp. 509]
MIVILKYSQALYFSVKGLGKAMVNRADSQVYRALSRNYSQRSPPIFSRHQTVWHRAIRIKAILQNRALTPTLYINCSPLLKPLVCETVANAATRSLNGIFAPRVTSIQFLSWLALSRVNEV